MKFYGDLERLAPWVDKCTVRNIVATSVGTDILIPLIGVYEDLRTLDLESLPDTCILKCSHGSGYNIVLRKKDPDYDSDKIMQFLRHCLDRNYFYTGFEPQYFHCHPCILVEPLLEDPNGPLLDYKFFCFDGKHCYVQVDLDRYTNHTRCFYDMNWNKMPFTTHYPIFAGQVDKPLPFQRMISIASKLSQGFAHVRVDLYCIGSSVYFGELTFTHGNGFERFYPDEWDFVFGDLMHLPR